MTENILKLKTLVLFIFLSNVVFVNVIHIEMKFKITGTALFYFITPNIILLGNDGPEFIMKFHTTSILVGLKKKGKIVQYKNS